jgi:ribose 5-phosphate isomerase B
MRVALASDHAGFDLKQAVMAELEARGIAHRDFGVAANERVDYIDYGAAAAAALSRGEFDRAILVCGTGLGMAIVANKFKGVRATSCWDEYTVEMSRKHNDANCLTLGGRTMTVERGLALVSLWLATPFEGGRHAARVEKIRELEERQFRP